MRAIGNRRSNAVFVTFQAHGKRNLTSEVSLDAYNGIDRIGQANNVAAGTVARLLLEYIGTHVDEYSALADALIAEQLQSLQPRKRASK